MRSARSAVMLSGLTVNSMRLENRAANKPEKLMSTISTSGRPMRLATSLIMSTPKPSGPEAPRTIHGATPKSEPTTSVLSFGWSASCAKAMPDIATAAAAATNIRPIIKFPIVSLTTRKDRASTGCVHAGPAVDRQGDAGDEVRLVGGEEQRGIGDVPAGAHLVAQRHFGIAHRLDLGAWLVELAGAGVDRHRRVHQAGQDDVGADAVLGVLVGELLREAHHRRLGRLVGDVGVGGEHGHRRDVDDGAALLLAHDRDHLRAGEDAALEIDRHAAVERLLGDLVELGIAARQRHADIVVQDVDAAPTAH